MAEPTGGWVHWAMISAQERERRLADAERAQADLDERQEHERRRLFGRRAGSASITRVNMPLSGRSFWWRSDGYVATLSAVEIADRDAHTRDADPLESADLTAMVVVGAAAWYWIFHPHELSKYRPEQQGAAGVATVGWTETLPGGPRVVIRKRVPRAHSEPATALSPPMVGGCAWRSC